MGRIIVLIIFVIVMLTKPVSAAKSDHWQPVIAEASERFGIPENWICAVIKTESNGESKAVSEKGAMGLMQLMPDTWEDMRNTLALGTDPFDPHDNILAGTAYLKTMYDRFGYPALFAAYNAGPARYEDHLRSGKLLPEETRAYAAELGKKIGFGGQFPPNVASGTKLFFALSTVEATDSNKESSAPPNGLFVRISTATAGEQ